MRAYLITAEIQNIESIDINSMDDFIKLVGYDTIVSDEIGTEGDRLYFDEECFLRGSAGRFQIDTLVPVSGKGVVVGTVNGGESLRDVVTDIDNLRNRIKYL